MATWDNSLTNWSKDAVCTRPGGTALVSNNIAADPHIIVLANGTLAMFFTAVNSESKMGIAYATSTNGYEWTVWQHPDENARDSIIDLIIPPTESFEEGGCETAQVIYGQDGTWRLYYTVDDVVSTNPTVIEYKIALATSSDGAPGTWAKQGVVFSKSLDWEKHTSASEVQGVLEPSILWDPALEKYVMWYAAIGQLDGVHAFRIGRAVSTNGTTWTRNPTTPVLVPGASGAWDDAAVSHVHVVADPTAGFHMFYHGIKVSDWVEPAEMQKGKIGHAYSAAGMSWTKDSTNPLIEPTANSADAWTCAGPSVWMTADGITLWYFGTPARYTFTPKIIMASYVP